MSYKLRFLCSILVFLSPLAFAENDDSTVIMARVTGDETVSNYWTAYRLQHARPVSLVARNRLPDLLPAITLHTPKQTESGTSKMLFTSSRLVPESANTVFPYTTIGKLYFTIPGKGDFTCTASVLQERLILTAGHCVHSGTNGKAGFYQNFMFIPAYHQGSAPFGQWTGNYVAVHKTWATGGGIIPNEADYAMIELKDRKIDSSLRRISSLTGHLGYQLESLDRNHAHLLGYACNLDNCEQMHQVTGETGRTVAAKNVEYGSDMREASDGSPWVQNFGEYGTGEDPLHVRGLNKIIGVISYFYSDPLLLSEGGSGMDNRFQTLLDKMCQHKPDNCL